MCLMRSSCSIGSRVRAITCACDDRKLHASVGVLRELERHAKPLACHRWLCGQAPALSCETLLNNGAAQAELGNASMQGT